MAKIYNSIDELIGSTPMLRLNNIEKALGLKARLLVKLEYFNPAGSVKDRIGKAMLDSYEAEGLINKNTVIIEPTSGNTGIGIACVAAARGYKCIIVMPDTMSKERIMLMSAYGAEVVLSDGKKGMAGAAQKAEELKKENPNAIIAGQFINPVNPEAHYLTTGPEIYNDTCGEVDIFVAGIGTGGTISGTGKYLKEQNTAIKIIGVEPSDSPLLTKGIAGAHKLQGIGANFIPEILNQNIIDDIITVTADEAYLAARLLGKTEGVLVGVSSGAALSAVISLAKREENAGKTIVALLPDTGERYLSTDLFE